MDFSDLKNNKLKEKMLEMISFVDFSIKNLELFKMKLIPPPYTPLDNKRNLDLNYVQNNFRNLTKFKDFKSIPDLLKELFEKKL